MQLCLSSKKIGSFSISIDSPIVGEPKEIIWLISLCLSGNFNNNFSLSSSLLIFFNFHNWHLEIIVSGILLIFLTRSIIKTLPFTSSSVFSIDS